jgi:hypothetical protein
MNYIDKIKGEFMSKLRWERELFYVLLAVFFIIGFYNISDAQEDESISKEIISDKKGEMPTTKRDINGVVVDMLSGEAVADAKVTLLTGESVTAGKDGRFTFKDIDEYHAIQITVRITTDLDVIMGCSYFSVPTTYYPVTANKDNKIDVQIVNMKNDDEVVLKIGEYDKDNIDKFCTSCHESNPCLVEEEYGKFVKNKAELKGILIRRSQLEEYIEEMRTKRMTIERYKNVRYVDSHPNGIDITASNSYTDGLTVLPDDLILKEGKIITCDTCHTRHIPTDWGQFVIMDFVQRESICIKCHK